MRKEQRDIDKLGAIGILKEGFKVFGAHSKFFGLIQLTLVLPVAIIVVAQQAVMLSFQPELPPPGIKSLPAHYRSTIGCIGLFIDHASAALGLQVDSSIVTILILTFLSAIFLIALQGLFAAATLYAVGLHYTGQSISFKEVVKAAIPTFWMRLTVLNLYQILLNFTIAGVELAGLFLLFQLGNSSDYIQIMLITIGMVLLELVAVIAVVIIFAVAAGVSVLEKDYGWAALSRSIKLLKGRVVVALWFQIIWLLPTSLINTGLLFPLIAKISARSFTPLSMALIILGVVVSIAYTTIYLQMTTIFAGVQYVSFKAFHNEDLEESFYENQAIKSGYQHVPTQV